ncbi:hypothetical protein F2Q65_17370 [Thiohalocapsa marina]|uniref:Uncharacterized protein n=1 Tax=Thiohalocapsa marina TaxID=424902 RepID=A0A5M8FP98_9GAMM|nr:hypothetical protein [Thiohalocapsa marina]KAA6182742.1 hypothetical protein F2Q65_17370 [Thiohalocapsa marina]
MLSLILLTLAAAYLLAGVLVLVYLTWGPRPADEAQSNRYGPLDYILEEPSVWRRLGRGLAFPFVLLVGSLLWPIFVPDVRMRWAEGRAAKLKRPPRVLREPPPEAFDD